ncbi:CDP-glycerol glycerophosphotransferase family protein [Burkholderia mayonis]|uniref:CDP-glycerol glycerophosphotransferase family protein n=1 Tax=Burkholderia mayonis TaxID=1385591 RepID=UPI000B33E57F|nr:CDP-glycerol glycerophosphotransferase family protein [Burkholderia mayonis]
MNPKKKVRFLFQAASHWYCYASVYDAFRRDERYDMSIVALPYVRNGRQIGMPSWSFLSEQNVPFVHFENYDPVLDAPDVAFLHNPYDETRPDAYHAKALHARGIRIAYIPYGPDMGGGAANCRFQYRMETHALAWRIFARSEQHRKRFQQYLPGSIRRVVATGHPKLDQSYRASPDNPLTARVGDRTVVLWNPHFSVGFPADLRWSTFDRYLKFFCDLSARRDDVAIVLRPHPNLFDMLTLTAEGAAVTRAVMAFSQMRGNFVIDQSPLYRHAFEVSHALITDTSSLMYEYLACDKPILHLECEGGAGLNADAERMMKSLARARSARFSISSTPSRRVATRSARNGGA